MSRRFWSIADLELLREHYPDRRTNELAAALDRTVEQVYQAAARYGLAKSATYLASQSSGRMLRGKVHEAIKATQFKPGLQPWNKGLRGVVGVQEACRATQFKPGRAACEARNYLPIGSTRICAEGYLERKVTDDPEFVPARRWVAVHRLIWIEAHGPVPPGYVVVFRPGRRTVVETEITLDPLEMLTRAELMRRNSVHTRYPPELARVVQLRGALSRQINRRAKEAETL